MRTPEEPVINEDSMLESDEMEGQEAILVEEEVPVKKQLSLKKKVAKVVQNEEKKKKQKKRRSLFKKSFEVDDSKDEEEEEELEPVEEVSPKEVTKTVSKRRVVLLDPTDENEVKKQQAAQKIEYSRKLLEVALRPHDQATAQITEEDREKMTRAAFQQAAEARRLVEGDVDEDLATVISENASKGEAAAAKAQCILLPKTAPASCLTKTGGETGKTESVENGVTDEDQLPPESNRYTPQDLFEEAEIHATKARNHLEAILPVFECLPVDFESLPPQPMLPTQGIFTDYQEEGTLSTLGFDNTFQDTLLSITSLNEILDAPLSSTESKVEAPETAQAEDSESIKSKGRLGLFRRRSQKERSGHTDVHESTAAAEPSKSPNDGPVERFIATVVQNNDEDSVCSDISNRSELERIKALETRTESKLKEAMATDEAGSLSSWYGVPLFGADAPQKEKGKKTGGENTTHLLKTPEYVQGRARSFKELKPQFVTAPEFDPKILTSRSWDDVMAEKEEQERRIKEEELVKAKKKKWRLPRWGRHSTDKQAAKEDKALSTKQAKAKDSNDKQGKSSAGKDEGHSPESNGDDCGDLIPLSGPSILSNDEAGDRYAVLAKDTVEEREKKQAEDSEPAPKDVDMMPGRADPIDFRSATSLDTEQRSSNESDGIMFADVEIGAEQVEKKIMSRETVMEKINAPRDTKGPVEPSSLDRVRTLPNGVSMSGIETSTSMMDEIEKQNKGKKVDKKKGDKQQSKLSKLSSMFGKSKRNTAKTERKENGFEDSNPPAMCLVNTGSSSDCAQKAGTQTMDKSTNETSML